jgi:hypothetical protein
VKKVKRKILSISFALVLALSLILVTAVPAAANTVASSTMEFEESGALTHQGSGVYTGTIAMADGSYYVTSGPGESISTTGGFDIYAKVGATAYVEGMTPDSWTIGSDHDAYSESGPWGSWYDPDCADWDQYSLELTEDHWYLRYTATGESPMSGELTWFGDGTAYAAETDPGTNHDAMDITDPTQYSSGSAQEWGWNCGWGAERIPLQYPGFDLVVGGGAGNYTVTMTPAAAGSTQLTVEVPDILAISVDPTSIDFGSLVPGQMSSPYSITVTNVGTHQANVEVHLAGSSADLFKNNLKMRHGSDDFIVGGGSPVSWGTLISGLNMDASDYVETKLLVPSEYTPDGEETATLIFTATGT